MLFMKLSTRSKYGIRAILELAQNYDSGLPLRTKTIALDNEISVKYLEHLMSILKSAGFVRSIRGSKGGYILAKKPDQIKLNDIFNALEGPMITVECLEDEGYCTRAANCTVKQLWSEGKDAIEGVLKSKTLQDMVGKPEDNRALHHRV